MKNEILSSLAGLGVLLMVFAIAPGSLLGQTSSQKSGQPVLPSASSADSATSSANSFDYNSMNLRSAEEQFDREVRTMEQKMRSQVSDLQRMAKEVSMSSPQLGKIAGLSAELQNESGEIESRANELAAQAQELAGQAQDKITQEFDRRPDFFGRSTDDDSGWLGIEIADVTPETAKNLNLRAVRGAIVKDVEPDSPAAKAGLKENDVITKYDGETVESTMQFRRLVRETPPGRNVDLVVSRGGHTQNISVALGDRGAFMQKQMEGKMRDFGRAYEFSPRNFDFHFDMPESVDFRTPVLGISAEDLTSQLGAYFGAPNDAGVLVREVRPDTPAEKAGIKAGDVIVKVNGNAVRSLADLRLQLRQKSDEKSVNLGILRKGAELSVSVTIEKPHPMQQSNMIHRAQL
ncbi:MAG: PDZ domain-containing protein [Candidatus Acidiferrales bacterium]